MKVFWEKYKDTIILLGSILIGGIAGLIFKEKTDVVKPLGDIFLNLMYMILVPLIFFSISSAIGQMKAQRRLGKIIIGALIVFLFTSFVSAIVGYIGVSLVNPVKGIDSEQIKALMGNVEEHANNQSIMERIVNLFTVSEFSDLLLKEHMLPLILMSVLVGLATSAVGEVGKSFADFLSAGNAVMMKLVRFIMYYAPIGLGCYFATVIGNLGGEIIGGYAKTFILYIGMTIFYFVVVMSGYAAIAGGKEGFRSFWRHISAPAVTAIATCSSAASIPVNIEYTKKMGVPDDIVDTIIPLGANTHKDGSIIGGVLKIVFLFHLFNKPIDSLYTVVIIILGAFFVGVVMGSIPGGGMIAETLIVMLFGFPVQAIPLIIIIGTIIDMPATLLNSSCNTVTAMMVARFVEGKNWLKNQVG